MLSGPISKASVTIEYEVNGKAWIWYFPRAYITSLDVTNDNDHISYEMEWAGNSEVISKQVETARQKKIRLKKEKRNAK
jgi:hypothetical protein